MQFIPFQSESACVSVCEKSPRPPPPFCTLKQCCGSRWSCVCGRGEWCGGGAWASQGGRTGAGDCKGEGEAEAVAEGCRPLWRARGWTWPTGWAGGPPVLGWGRPPSALVHSGPQLSPWRFAGTGWVFLGAGPRAGQGWAGRVGQPGPVAWIHCWAGPVDRSAACCELTPSLGTVRERMRSYQPERSLYAALRCYTHGHAGMQVGSMRSERMHSTHTLSSLSHVSAWFICA